MTLFTLKTQNMHLFRSLSRNIADALRIWSNAQECDAHASWAESTKVHPNLCYQLMLLLLEYQLNDGGGEVDFRIPCRYLPTIKINRYRKTFKSVPNANWTLFMWLQVVFFFQKRNCLLVCKLRRDSSISMNVFLDTVIMKSEAVEFSVAS